MTSPPVLCPEDNLPRESNVPASRQRPLVRLQNIGKTYDNGTLALAGIELEIGQGEFISLLGPSGCGKSTLLRLIAGLNAPSTGEIDWPTADYDVTGRARPKLGFVFQEPTLMPWANVFNNVFLPLRLLGMSRRAAVDLVRETLVTVGLERFAEAFPRQLSGGMKMRVSIARALVTRPQVLLMDEPFAALDEITRFRLNDDLLRLFQAQKWTVVFVTHSVFESVYLSTRIIVMDARPGRIQDDLPIAAAYPRGGAFRLSPLYNDLCQQASAALKRTTAGEEEDH